MTYHDLISRDRFEVFIVVTNGMADFDSNECYEYTATFSYETSCETVEEKVNFMCSLAPISQ